MISLAVLIGALAAAPLFDVYEIPLDAVGARSFVAEADGDGVADLFVLDGNVLRYYDDGLLNTVLNIELAADTTAVDLCDVDDDGFVELVVLAGRTLLRYPLVGDGAGKPVEMFRLKAAPPGFHAPPFLHVMCVREPNGTQIALPNESGIVLYFVDGTPVSTSDQPASGAAPSFDAWVVDRSALAGANDMEIRFEHAWQPDRIPGSRMDSLGATPSVGPFRLRDAATETPSRWPWVTLRSAKPASEERAYIAVQGAETGETLVAVQRRPSESSTDLRMGPIRRYPGQPLWQSGATPDFNGDGLTDLTLWRTRRPAPTLNSLSRAIAEGQWPVDITVHLFDAAASSFSPRASGSIRVHTPITRFFDTSQGIVAHAVLADFNGDGFDDIGCATAPDTFSVWLWSEDRLSDTPAFAYRAGRSILSVLFHRPMTVDGASAIGLETETGLVFLRPAGLAMKPGAPEDPAVRARIRYLQGLVGSP